jgi:hypothetical protein
MAQPIRLSDFRKRGKSRVTFERHELRQLMDMYSRRVAAGEWRDYAIDLNIGAAVFSIFRNTYDSPLFSIAKFGNNGHCDYMVFSGMEKVKQGKSINEVLAVFNRKPYLVALTR